MCETCNRPWNRCQCVSHEPWVGDGPDVIAHALGWIDERLTEFGNIDPRHPSQYDPFPSPTARSVMSDIERVKDLFAMANDNGDVAAEASEYLRMMEGR